MAKPFGMRPSTRQLDPFSRSAARTPETLANSSLPSCGGFPMTNKMAALFLVTLLAVAFAPLVGRHP